MGVIFDMDQTIVDSNIALTARSLGDWAWANSLISNMRPYKEVVKLINELVKQGVKVAIVSSSPRNYCEKVLAFCGIDINSVTTVFYHDTKEHKPSVEPYKLAMKKMGIESAKEMIIVGDDVTDIKPANEMGATSIWANWGREEIEFTDGVEPNVMCQDTEYLVRYFMLRGIGEKGSAFREINPAEKIYALFDYYPTGEGKSSDEISRKILDELKKNNKENYLCEIFSREILRDFQLRGNQHKHCGVFVVPSSKVNKWNAKIEQYVVPEIVKQEGMYDCSKYICRHTEHAKQHMGGTRDKNSHMATMRVQEAIPKHIDSAIILDDITTSGNIFSSCIDFLVEAGIRQNSIYCYAVGGTSSI